MKGYSYKKQKTHRQSPSDKNKSKKPKKASKASKSSKAIKSSKSSKTSKQKKVIVFPKYDLHYSPILSLSDRESKSKRS